MNTVSAVVWVGDCGEHVTPSKFSTLKFSKSGAIDKRRTADYYQEFKSWLEGQEEMAKKNKGKGGGKKC